MRASFTALALMAGLTLSSAAAIPAQKRSLLSALGISTGTNSETSTSTAWIGNDGDYVNEFTNTCGEDIEVVVWGPDASWVNVNTPLITYSLANGSSFNVSFASGLSGAWAAIYNDTTMVNGQISETWGEYTFDGEYSTFDVSRLVNMDGHDMAIESSECVSNMETCVFTCTGDATSCWLEYELLNCTGQAGSESGTYDGAASGGCLVGSKNKVTTLFY